MPGNYSSITRHAVTTLTALQDRLSDRAKELLTAIEQTPDALPASVAATGHALLDIFKLVSFDLVQTEAVARLTALHMPREPKGVWVELQRRVIKYTPNVPALVERHLALDERQSALYSAWDALLPQLPNPQIAGALQVWSNVGVMDNQPLRVEKNTSASTIKVAAAEAHGATLQPQLPVNNHFYSALLSNGERDVRFAQAAYEIASAQVTERGNGSLGSDFSIPESRLVTLTAFKGGNEPWDVLPGTSYPGLEALRGLPTAFIDETAPIVSPAGRRNKSTLVQQFAGSLQGLSGLRPETERFLQGLQAGAAADAGGKTALALQDIFESVSPDQYRAVLALVALLRPAQGSPKGSVWGALENQLAKLDPSLPDLLQKCLALEAKYGGLFKEWSALADQLQVSPGQSKEVGTIDGAALKLTRTVGSSFFISLLNGDPKASAHLPSQLSFGNQDLEESISYLWARADFITQALRVAKGQAEDPDRGAFGAGFSELAEDAFGWGPDPKPTVVVTGVNSGDGTNGPQASLKVEGASDPDARLIHLPVIQRNAELAVHGNKAVQKHLATASNPNRSIRRRNPNQLWQPSFRRNRNALRAHAAVLRRRQSAAVSFARQTRLWGAVNNAYRPTMRINVLGPRR